mmetsp:Transcript_12639/g.25596  ORF Transcript_12639/g.25596 Transcript_12639/m.25596 type:complete len:281 (+) Transcript_12639:579-1421(+)
MQHERRRHMLRTKRRPTRRSLPFRRILLLQAEVEARLRHVRHKPTDNNNNNLREMRRTTVPLRDTPLPILMDSSNSLRRVDTDSCRTTVNRRINSSNSRLSNRNNQTWLPRHIHKLRHFRNSSRVTIKDISNSSHNRNRYLRFGPLLLLLDTRHVQRRLMHSNHRRKPIIRNPSNKRRRATMQRRQRPRRIRPNLVDTEIKLLLYRCRHSRRTTPREDSLWRVSRQLRHNRLLPVVCRLRNVPECPTTTPRALCRRPLVRPFNNDSWRMRHARYRNMPIT